MKGAARGVSMVFSTNNTVGDAHDVVLVLVKLSQDLLLLLLLALVDYLRDGHHGGQGQQLVSHAL